MPLSGKRVAVLVEQQYQELEVWHPVYRLREAGCVVTLVGPEARGSAPVRIVRDAETRETPGVTGLYPVGEGAGYAGGIVSAAVDGLRTAKAIVGRYAGLEAKGGSR